MHPLDVLLVDDDLDLLSFLSLFIAGRGHTARTANSLGTAWNEISRQCPDVIVSDFSIGDERGDVLLERVFQEHPNVRRILYTGRMPSHAKEIVDRRIAHRVILKRIEIDELFRSIIE